ncbi:histidine kinase [Chryseobacterium sp. MEBOG06]|uniref:sensor histidine kinase n=1 Tax=Chryseobacterium sp. MEBOG06 TaxID=2879938 RepID=UPI001F016FA0|nr:histidine kinase [Chryseobacterium sp. MEBOG06]UKB84054.1 histidine kinase [Chryseobacterium sp. MEBOG06]
MARFFVLRKHTFIILFWLVFTVAIWINFQATSNGYTAVFQTFVITATSFIFTHFLTTKLLPKALRSKRMGFFLTQATLIIFALSFIYSLIFTYVKGSSDTVLPPDFSDQIPILWKGFYLALPASFLINGAACGVKFYQEHGKIERDHILLQQAHLENQLKLLQDQINPHVVFNILNHIHILMRTDTQLADYLLLKFSDILRYQLYHCNQNTVPLDKDIEHIQNLVEVEKLRWGNELDVTTIWEISSNKAFIAPLLLVTFIENAFKYVCRLPGHKGHISISCMERDKVLSFYIENSYSDVLSYKKKDGVGGIGLENVKKRLKLQYPGSHDLKIEADQNIFKVTLTLNLAEYHEYYYS